jgi:hypothetical protein
MVHRRNFEPEGVSEGTRGGKGVFAAWSPKASNTPDSRAGGHRLAKTSWNGTSRTHSLWHRIQGGQGGMQEPSRRGGGL